MTEDVFRQNKPTPDCLSHLRASRYVLGELEPEEERQVETHIETCLRCRELIDGEREQLLAAAHERVPERLLAMHVSEPTRAPSRWMQWSLVAAAAAVVGAIVFFSLPGSEPGPGPGLRTKGEISLDVTLRRNGKILAECVSVDSLQNLRQGDELRPRVTGAAGRHVALRGCEHESCETFFRGATPVDGWIPTGLTATAGRSALELLVCASEDDLRGILTALGHHPVSSTLDVDCKFKTWELLVLP